MKPYTLLTDDQSFAFSAENPTGKRGGGSRGGDCTKLSPTVSIPAGGTVTLVDIDGPGVIQNIWFTGYVGHSFILRIYWDDQKYPSVEAPLSAFFGCAYDENFVDRDGRYPVLNSAVMLVAPGRGYNCFFEMPFQKRCRITMENRSEEVKNLYYIITGCLKERTRQHRLFPRILSSGTPCYERPQLYDHRRNRGKRPVPGCNTCRGYEREQHLLGGRRSPDVYRR